jgi:membrane protease YdiL (CAAX protease family)
MDVSPANLNILNAIMWTVLFGSIYSIVLLSIYGRKHPVRRDILTYRMLERIWAGREAGALLAGFAGLMVLLPLVYSLAGGTDSALAQTNIVLIFSIAQLIILIGIARLRKRNWAADFGMAFRKLNLLPFSLTIYLAVIPFLGLTSWLYNSMLEHWLGMEPDVQDAALLIAESRAWIKVGLILLSVLAAPLYEELIFRGVFFPYLTDRIGFYPAILVVSIVFSAVHFHIPSLLPLSLLSIVLCLAYWRTGSLWVSIGLHAIFNGMSIILILLMQ